MRSQRGKSQVCASYFTFIRSPTPYVPSSGSPSPSALSQKTFYSKCHCLSATLSFYWSFIPVLSLLLFPGILDHLQYFSPAPLKLCPTKFSTHMSSLGHEKYSVLQPIWIYTYTACTLKVKRLAGFDSQSVPWRIMPIFHRSHKQLRGVLSLLINLIRNWIGFKVISLTILGTTD